MQPGGTSTLRGLPDMQRLPSPLCSWHTCEPTHLHQQQHCQAGLDLSHACEQLLRARCFAYELAAAKPNWADVARGFIPKKELITNSDALFNAIGILGATVRPPGLDALDCALTAVALETTLLGCCRRRLHAPGHVPGQG